MNKIFHVKNTLALSFLLFAAICTAYTEDRDDGPIAGQAVCTCTCVGNKDGHHLCGIKPPDHIICSEKDSEFQIPGSECPPKTTACSGFSSNSDGNYFEANGNLESCRWKTPKENDESNY